MLQPSEVCHRNLNFASTVLNPQYYTWMNTVLNDIEPHNLILNDGSQYRSESPTLEVAGYEQHYALIEARNDDDDDTIHLPNFI